MERTASFGALVREGSAGIEGLRLLDGALVLKIERENTAGRVRIEDGETFDPEGGRPNHLSVGMSRRGHAEWAGLALSDSLAAELRCDD